MAFRLLTENEAPEKGRYRLLESNPEPEEENEEGFISELGRAGKALKESAKEKINMADDFLNERMPHVKEAITTLFKHLNPDKLHFFDKVKDIETPKNQPTQKKSLRPPPGGTGVEARKQFAQELVEERERGQGEFEKGLIHTATTGGILSKLTQGEEGKRKSPSRKVGEFAGSFIPIEGIHAVYGPKLVDLALKSPIAKQALSSLARITGMATTGATYEGLEKLNKGEIPSFEEILEKGGEWAVLDALIQGAGLTGRFAKNLLRKSEETGLSKKELTNLITDKLKGQQEKTGEKALDILESIGKKEGPPKVPRLEGQPAQPPKQQRQIKVEAKPIQRVSEESPSLAEPYKPNQFKAENIEQRLLQEEETRFSKEKKRFEKETEQHKIESQKAKEEASLEEQLELETEHAVREKETNKLLDEISPRAKNKKELGERVKKGTEDYLEKQEKIYQPLYEKAEQIQNQFTHKAEQTISVIENLLKELKKFKIRPKGYDEVIQTAETLLKDIGHTKTAKIGGHEFELPSPLTLDLKISEMNEIAKRLNKIAKYDIVGPDIRKQLNRISHSLKEEIGFATELADSSAGKAFREAESKYGETARNLKRTSVNKARGEEATEKIVQDALKSPTSLEDLKKVLSDTDFKALEREILENLKGMSPEKAQEYLREFKDILSSKASKNGQKIIEQKLNPPKEKKVTPREIAKPNKPEAKEVTLTNKQKRKDAIEKDLEKSFEEGKRPKKTMDLWETKEGQKLVREALEGNPDKKEIIEYLQKQYFYDFLSSVIEKDGKIDFEAFNEMLKDPLLADNIKMIGGPNALSTFKTLESMSNKMKKNAEIFENLKQTGKAEPTERGKHLIKQTGRKNTEKLEATHKAQHPLYHGFKRLEDMMGVSGKTILGLMGFSPYGSFTPGGIYVGMKIMFSLAQNKRVRNAWIRASNANPHNTKMYLQAFDDLKKALNEKQE